MSASNQSNGLPWSRGRGFRPQGAFQPARRPGTNGGGGDSRPSGTDTRPGSSSSVNQVTNGMAKTSLNQGYSSHNNTSSHSNSSSYSNNTGNSANSRQGSNPSNGYQDNRRTPSATSSSSHGNSGTRDFRFAGNNTSAGGSSGPAKNQVQSKQNGTGPGTSQGAPNNGSKKSVAQVLAKYNYKANPASPLGEPELSLKQGQKLTLIGKHPDNEQWWRVGGDDGSQGYAPASYLMLVDTKPSALPWLENQKMEELPEAKPVFKAYQSAYTRPAADEKEEQTPSDRYYCKVCDKRLNGPKPYGAHMVSKAHKEEVDYAAGN